MSLFKLFFGNKKENTFFAELTAELKDTLEPILLMHFLNYQKKMRLLSLFENKQIKSRDFSKRFKRLCSLPTKGQIGSFEKKEIAKILSLLNSAIDKEQNSEIKSLEKDEQKLLADLSEQINKLAKNLQAQHSWLAENISSIESPEDITELKALLIAEGKIIYEIEETDLSKINAEIDLILHKAKYPEGSLMAEKMLKEKKRRKKWLESKAKKGFITLYHAYPKKYAPNPLIEGGLLDKKVYAFGFYMAKQDDEAIDAVSYQKAGKYNEEDLNVLVVQIQVDIFEKICVSTGSEVAWDIYFNIPVEKYDAANKAIKQGLIKFSKF